MEPEEEYGWRSNPHLSDLNHRLADYLRAKTEEGMGELGILPLIPLLGLVAAVGGGTFALSSTLRNQWSDGMNKIGKSLPFLLGGVGGMLVAKHAPQKYQLPIFIASAGATGYGIYKIFKASTEYYPSEEEKEKFAVSQETMAAVRGIIPTLPKELQSFAKSIKVELGTPELTVESEANQRIIVKAFVSNKGKVQTDLYIQVYAYSIKDSVAVDIPGGNFLFSFNGKSPIAVPAGKKVEWKKTTAVYYSKLKTELIPLEGRLKMRAVVFGPGGIPIAASDELDIEIL